MPHYTPPTEATITELPKLQARKEKYFAALRMCELVSDGNIPSSGEQRTQAKEMKESLLVRIKKVEGEIRAKIEALDSVSPPPPPPKKNEDSLASETSRENEEIRLLSSLTDELNRTNSTVQSIVQILFTWILRENKDPGNQEFDQLVRALLDHESESNGLEESVPEAAEPDGTGAESSSDVKKKLKDRFDEILSTLRRHQGREKDTEAVRSEGMIVAPLASPSEQRKKTAKPEGEKKAGEDRSVIVAPKDSEPAETSPTEYMTFQEVLEELKIDEEELKRFVSSGVLGASRSGGGMKFKKVDVEGLQNQESAAEVILGVGESDQDVHSLQTRKRIFALQDETFAFVKKHSFPLPIDSLRELQKRINVADNEIRNNPNTSSQEYAHMVELDGFVSFLDDINNILLKEVINLKKKKHGEELVESFISRQKPRFLKQINEYMRLLGISEQEAEGIREGLLKYVEKLTRSS